MVLKIQRKIKIDKYGVSCLLAYTYIFTSYVAQGILLDAAINSFFLYAFLLSAAYICVTAPRFRRGSFGFAGWYLVFLLISGLLMFLSPSLSGVYGAFYAMLVTFLVFLCLQIHVRSDEQFTAMCWCYAISAFAFVLLLLLTGNLEGDAENRLGQELLGNANIFATMMMVGAIYTIWLLVYDANKLGKKVTLVAMLLLDMYALVLSGGRKFFVVPFIFLYILLWYRSDTRGKRHIVWYTVLFAILIIGIWNLIMRVPLFYDAIGVRMEGLLENITGEGGDASAVIREKMRKLALEKWIEKPIIGYGFDSFKYLAQQEVGHFYYSHCNYTELLYSGGIFYLVLYYWIFWKILRRCIKNKDIPVSFKAFAMASVISMLLFDYGAVTYNSTSQMIMLMMAYCASGFRISNTTNAQGDIL